MLQFNWSTPRLNLSINAFFVTLLREFKKKKQNSAVFNVFLHLRGHLCFTTVYNYYVLAPLICVQIKELNLCVCIVLQLKNIWDSRSRPVQIKLIMNGSGSGSNLLRVLSIENDILIIEEAGAAEGSGGQRHGFHRLRFENRKRDEQRYKQNDSKFNLNYLCTQKLIQFQFSSKHDLLNLL